MKNGAFTQERIKAEAVAFFEWDGEDRSVVTTTSCLLFAHHIAGLVQASAAQSAPDEVFAIPVRENGKRTTFYTEALPFVPGPDVEVLGEPVRMVAAQSAPAGEREAVAYEHWKADMEPYGFSGLDAFQAGAAWQRTQPDHSEQQLGMVPDSDEYPECDYCGEVPDHHPWHGSGMLNGLESRHIHACNACQHKLPTPQPPAQPEPAAQGEFGDAYQGAREDLAIWKRRALEAEAKVRHQDQIIDHLTLEAQGETRMGEPFIAQGQQSPNYWRDLAVANRKVADEALAELSALKAQPREEDWGVFASEELKRYDSYGNAMAPCDPESLATFVLASDYAALEAECERLRSQVSALQSDANSWQSGYDKGREDGAKAADGWKAQHARDSAELRRLCAERDALAAHDKQSGGAE